MSIKIKISKKIEEIEENHPIEYYEIHAETSHIQKQCRIVKSALKEKMTSNIY